MAEPYECPECGEKQVYFAVPSQSLACLSDHCTFNFVLTGIQGIDRAPNDRQANQILARAKEKHGEYKKYCMGENGIEFIKSER